jgi:RimJ/RimL family protein N-acetyltransferase
MKIRKVCTGDLDEVMEIYASARKFMKDNGNADQWGNTHPSREMIESDITENTAHAVIENNEIVGVFYFDIIDDPTYMNIYDGTWLNNEKYGVIHRIAVKYHGRNIVGFIFNYCYGIIKNLKIDTHRQNLPMQRSLEKNGFKRCGIIYLESGAERIAYQKTE